MPPEKLDPAILCHTRCRICKSALAPILSLGPQYLVDFPNAAGTKRHAPVPLDLTRCTNPACELVQLAHTTPAAWMYQQHYWYRSGVNESMVAELRDIVQGALRRVELPRTGIVVDIGANDGTLLQQYAQVLPEQRLIKVAYEPARNLYEVLRPHATVLFPEFFRVDKAWEPSQRAKIVTSIAMFYDLEDPHEFVEHVSRILAPDGVWVVQQSYLPLMFEANDYTNICHEHVEYYHLKPFEALLEAHGLEVFDVELRPINGGSIRTYIRWQTPGTRREEDSVVAMRRTEQELFGDDLATVSTDFAQRVTGTAAQLINEIHDLRALGKTIDLYGASTKSQVMLQYCNLDGRVIRQAWERSPEKWGRYAGTSAIPMVSEAVGRAEPPDVLLAAIWQYRDVLLTRESEFLAKGGRVLFPLPKVELVNAASEAARG